MNIPDELNDDLVEILGRPNFACGAIAHCMVAAGEVAIRPKAEVEQAVVIHKLLGFYAEHGAKWREAAGAWLEELRVKAQSRAADMRTSNTASTHPALMQ